MFSRPAPEHVDEEPGVVLDNVLRSMDPRHEPTEGSPAHALWLDDELADALVIGEAASCFERSAE